MQLDSPDPGEAVAIPSLLSPESHFQEGIPQGRLDPKLPISRKNFLEQPFVIVFWIGAPTSQLIGFDLGAAQSTARGAFPRPADNFGHLNSPTFTGHRLEYPIQPTR